MRIRMKIINPKANVKDGQKIWDHYLDAFVPAHTMAEFSRIWLCCEKFLKNLSQLLSMASCRCCLVPKDTRSFAICISSSLRNCMSTVSQPRPVTLRKSKRPLTNLSHRRKTIDLTTTVSTTPIYVILPYPILSSKERSFVSIFFASLLQL